MSRRRAKANTANNSADPLLLFAVSRCYATIAVAKKLRNSAVNAGLALFISV